MWKDFLYYTKTERQGIIVLVVLILEYMQLLNSLPFSLVPKIPAAQRMRNPIKNIMTLLPLSGKQNLTTGSVILFHQPLKGNQAYDV